MVRLAISVEGQTEEIFVNKVIVPYLERMEIYAQPILLGNTGGDVSFSRIKKDLNTLANSFDNVTTLYDFYGFRGKNENETKETLEQRITDTVAVPLHGRILPYVQMYEFEGLLFSSPDAIANNLGDPELVAWAESILRQFGNDPERINDSPQTAPSKRLASETNYIKTVHGPNICKETGLDELRQKCTGFNAWLTSLEALQ